MRASLKLTLLLPMLLCGCKTGFDRDALTERLKDGSVHMPDSAIAEARGLKPQLRFPCRVAVYLQTASGDWRWTPEDKAAMEVWAAALKKDGIAADVFPLPEMLACKKGDLKELRLAAAKCGADVLLVMHGAADTDSHLNPLSVFNLTVVGGFIVPGSNRDSLFMLEGVLLDVDNGYVYTGVQAEGVGKIMRPTFVIEDKDAIAKAKGQALTRFGDEFVKRMRRLKIGPAFISDINYPSSRDPNVILDPNGFEIPADTGRVPNVPAIQRAIPNAGDVMTGITAPRPLP